MDQIKIGKLIAKLRKEKGLTQKELGDMVGVGYRAVSKWERGINLPDSSLYKPLCDIFNITIDELLNGKIIKDINNKKKIKERYILILITVLILFLFLSFLNLFILNKSTKVYALKSQNQNEYHVDGKLTIDNQNLSIYINNIEFEDYAFNQIIVKDYYYELVFDNKILYKYGYGNNYNSLSYSTNIKEFTEIFKINYNDNISYKIRNTDSKDLVLKLKIIDGNDNVIIKNIMMKLVPKNV